MRKGGEWPSIHFTAQSYEMLFLCPKQGCKSPGTGQQAIMNTFLVGLTTGVACLPCMSPTVYSNCQRPVTTLYLFCAYSLSADVCG